MLLNCSHETLVAYNNHGLFNLETSVESRKSAQALGVPSKAEKCLITNKVTTNFYASLCTPISYVSFSRPTEVSRFKSSLGKSTSERTRRCSAALDSRWALMGAVMNRNRVTSNSCRLTSPRLLK